MYWPDTKSTPLLKMVQQRNHQEIIYHCSMRAEKLPRKRLHNLLSTPVWTAVFARKSIPCPECFFYYYFYWKTDCIELHSLQKNKFHEGKVSLHRVTETLTSSKVGDSPIYTEKSLQQHLTDSETEPRYGMMLAQSMIPQHRTQLWMQLINNISKYQVTSNNNRSFSDIGNIIREEEEILLPSKVNTNEMLRPTAFFK